MFYTRGPKVLYVSFTMEDPKSRATQKKIGYLHSANGSTDIFQPKQAQNTKMAFSKEAVNRFRNFLVILIGTEARQIGVTAVFLVNFL